MPKELKVDLIHALIERDFTDPYNLIPLLMVGTIIIYTIAIFADRPPE